MPGLGTSYGRGGATTNQMDVRFADAVFIMGSNMAECHPVSFRFVMQAKLAGAKVIHVDPRFTRTSAMADIYAPLRAGSDIVFLGGLIRHVLEEEKYFKDYVARLHQRGHPDQRRVPGYRGSRRPLLRIRPRAQGVRPEDLAIRRRADASDRATRLSESSTTPRPSAPGAAG